jgi:hypothetical protein
MNIVSVSESVYFVLNYPIFVFQLLIPTGMRYLVAIDVRSQMVHGKCWHCSNISPTQAAVLVTLCLVKAERDVTVVAFGAEGSMQPVELDKNITMKETQNKLKEVWELFVCFCLLAPLSTIVE